MHPHVSWILSRQAALAILLATIAWVLVSSNAAGSIVIGGSIGLIANAVRMTGAGLAFALLPLARRRERTL